MSNIGKVSAAALVAAAMLVQAPVAKAEDGRNAAAALGVLGGIAAGAAIAGQGRDPQYEGYRPRRRIYNDNNDDAQVCYIERRRVENEYGEVRIRRVRVCE